MEKNIDELKKKVLELRDVIDKQNDLIVKYQKAMRIAADELEEATKCDCFNRCPIVDFCDPDEVDFYDPGERECTKRILQHWKDEVGIE